MLSQKQELKDRVAAKQKQIEAQIARLKASGRSSARDEIEELEAKVEEAREALQEGWDRVSDAAAAKLNEWLKD